MSLFKRGQIWLVNFDPSSGHEYQKVRPALIVQNDEYIEQSNLIPGFCVKTKCIH